MSLRPRIPAILGDCYRESAWNRDLLRITSITRPSACPPCSSSSRSGKSVALVSDAGTPLISDPGLAARQRGARRRHRRRADPRAVRSDCGVVHLRACRPIISCSRGSCRGAKALAPRASMRCAREQRTIVLYEAVHRVAETLAALRDAFGADRRAAIARELTKTHEQIATGTLAELAERLGSSIPLLGEFVVVVAGAAAAAPDETEARARLRAARGRARARPGIEARGRRDGRIAQRALSPDSDLARRARRAASTLAAGVGWAAAGGHSLEESPGFIGQGAR